MTIWHDALNGFEFEVIKENNIESRQQTHTSSANLLLNVAR